MYVHTHIHTYTYIQTYIYTNPHAITLTFVCVCTHKYIQVVFCVSLPSIVDSLVKKKNPGLDPITMGILPLLSRTTSND